MFYCSNISYITYSIVSAFTYILMLLKMLNL